VLEFDDIDHRGTVVAMRVEDRHMNHVSGKHDFDRICHQLLSAGVARIREQDFPRPIRIAETASHQCATSDPWPVASLLTDI
jgi:hypothetical protein